MALVVVIAVEEPPVVGGAAPARVYLGDHANATEAITAAVAALAPSGTTRMWATLATNFNRVRIEVSRTNTVIDEQ